MTIETVQAGFKESVSVPELLNEILALFDDVDCNLQRGLLLLAKAFDEILHRLN